MNREAFQIAVEKGDIIVRNGQRYIFQGYESCANQEDEKNNTNYACSYCLGLMVLLSDHAGRTTECFTAGHKMTCELEKNRTLLEKELFEI